MLRQRFSLKVKPVVQSMVWKEVLGLEKKYCSARAKQWSQKDGFTSDQRYCYGCVSYCEYFDYWRVRHFFWLQSFRSAAWGPTSSSFSTSSYCSCYRQEIRKPGIPQLTVATIGLSPEEYESGLGNKGGKRRLPCVLDVCFEGLPGFRLLFSADLWYSLQTITNSKSAFTDGNLGTSHSSNPGHSILAIVKLFPTEH